MLIAVHESQSKTRAGVHALAFPSRRRNHSAHEHARRDRVRSQTTAPPEQSELLRFLAAQLRETATDEADYLMSSPANREHLLRVTVDIAAGRNIVEPDQAKFR